MSSPEVLMTKIQTSRLNHWLLCFVVCNFNVDIGPEVEFIYPPNITFSQSDLSAICFNSFPERHDGDLAEDTYFNFTIPNNSPDLNLSSPSAPYGSSDLLHGICMFRQEHDHMTKRKFNQKSLVIVSNHAFYSLFINLLRIITASSAISDPTRLEAACAQISQWNTPRFGKQDLPFLGALMSFEIPPYPSFPLSGYPSPFSATSGLLVNLSAYEPTETWSSLIPLFSTPSMLYILFEKLMIGESVIVLGQHPQPVSTMITALLDLIRPISYSGIIRPYLVMQSSSLSGDVSIFDQSDGDSFIVGIVNPFLLQRLSNISSNPPFILTLHSNHHQYHHNHSISSLRPSNSTKKHQIDLPGSPITTQPKPIHYLKHDRQFLASLTSDENGASGASLGVRRHFADLTARILSPINRFLATRSVTSTSDRVEYPSSATSTTEFDVDDFIISLSKQSTPVPFVGQTSHGRHKARDQFYRKFCSSKNFNSWRMLTSVTGKQLEAGLLN